MWEAGDNTPHSSSYRQDATLRLELVERRLADARPLVTALLLQATNLPSDPYDRGLKAFERHAFAQNALGCPDIADFFVHQKDVVCQLLHLGDPTIIARLDEASVPVAPFAHVLAELAADARVTLRRPALKLLARDTAAAGVALRAIESDEDRKPKQRELASRALGLLGAGVPSTESEGPVETDIDVPTLSASARAKLRALCDEWLAQATPKFAAHRALTHTLARGGSSRSTTPRSRGSLATWRRRSPGHTRGNGCSSACRRSTSSRLRGTA